jgi:hypothetical protein
VDRPAGDEFLGFGGVGRHVRRGRVRLERVHAFPLLDHQEGIGTPFGLKGQRRIGIDRGPVLDAALFGPHRGNVGAEVREDGLALAGLGGNDGDDMDHFLFPFS